MTAQSATQRRTHYRTCNLCEAMCGLEIELEGTEVLAIRGDPADPLSQGHICPKAVALQDVYADPDRLKHPVRRTPAGWEQISWEEAFDEVARQLKGVRERHGPDAVAVYQGNPSVHNVGTLLTAPGFFKSLGTRSRYSATSVDQLPHHFAAWQMFGHPFLLPIPDLDRTQHWLILGANPLASNGSIMTSPNVRKRLKAIQARGGKVVVLDPRRTETAEAADTHHFIRPGSDVLFLLAFVNVLFAEGYVRLERLSGFTESLEALREATLAFTPEQVAGATGLEAAALRQIVGEFAESPSAVCYGRIGLSTQAFGGLCQWLVNAVNVLTGNLDRAGGAMFTSPAVEMVRSKGFEEIFGRWKTRVRGLPEFDGELPVSALAEEILTPGEGQIRALVTSCGNPVLSTPNGRQLEQALGGLEFMVAVDLYVNETTRHAHLILPPATGLETAHYDLVFHTFAVRNTAKYSDPLFPKAEGAKYDWEIFEELRNRMTLPEGTELPAPRDPAEKLEQGLRSGQYGLNLEQLRANPHGLDLGPLQPRLPQRLLTPNQQINLAPERMLKDLPRAESLLGQAPSQLQLIGRRHLRSNNSWMHNSPRLVRGPDRCTLIINPHDAEARGIAHGSTVQVRSRVGCVEVRAEVSDTIMPGVVSLPHGYGHTREGTQLEVAQQHAGVSINDLTDELELDPLTGNAALSGVAVTVQPVA